MRIASPSRLMMVARTDKEARLRNFISEGLLPHDGNPASVESLTILVRNSESPIARALCCALAEPGHSVQNVRIIFGETGFDESAPCAMLDIPGAEFRFLSDARFGAAHEQMVLTGGRVWIGDCLRRDPTKRDAFELYHPDNSSARDLASASFERLWTIAKPVKRTATASVAPEIIAAGQTTDPFDVPGAHR